MFYGDEIYKEPMKQLLFQIIIYNFNVFEVTFFSYKPKNLDTKKFD